MKRLLLTTSFWFVTVFSSTDAQVPNFLPFVGDLNNSTGLPVSNGPHALTFQICGQPVCSECDQAECGLPLWEDTYEVETRNGNFNVDLGPLDPGLFNGPLYIGVSVGDGSPLLPFQPLGTAPFSFTAHNAFNLVNGAVTDVNSLSGSVTVLGGENVNISTDLTNNTITIGVDPGVTSINALPGDVAVVPGNNVNVDTDPANNTITIGTDDVVNTVNNLSDDVTVLQGNNVDVSTDAASNTITVGTDAAVREVLGGIGITMSGSLENPIVNQEAGGTGTRELDPAILALINSGGGGGGGSLNDAYTAGSAVTVTSGNPIELTGTGTVLKLASSPVFDPVGLEFLDGTTPVWGLTKLFSSNHLQLDNLGSPVIHFAYSSRNVGINTTNPATKLHVVGTSDAATFEGTVMTYDSGADAPAGVDALRTSYDQSTCFATHNAFSASALTGHDFVTYFGGSPLTSMTVGHFDVMFAVPPLPASAGLIDLGDASYYWATISALNALNVISDRRKKDSIQDITYGLDEIKALRPVSFTWKDHPERGTKLGLIAQEVQPVINEVVKVGDDEDQTLGVHYSDLIPVLIKAIQEQQQIIEAERAGKAKLSVRLNQTTTEVETLKAQMVALTDAVQSMQQSTAMNVAGNGEGNVPILD